MADAAHRPPLVIVGIGTSAGGLDALLSCSEPSRQPAWRSLLSGYAGADIRDACLDAGFDAYLVEPGDIPALERLLASDRADPDASRH